MQSAQKGNVQDVAGCFEVADDFGENLAGKAFQATAEFMLKVKQGHFEKFLPGSSLLALGVDIYIDVYSKF